MTLCIGVLISTVQIIGSSSGVNWAHLHVGKHVRRVREEGKRTTERGETGRVREEGKRTTDCRWDEGRLEESRKKEKEPQTVDGMRGDWTSQGTRKKNHRLSMESGETRRLFHLGVRARVNTVLYVLYFII